MASKFKLGVAPWTGSHLQKKITEEKIEEQRINSNVTTIDPSEDAILMEAGFILKDFIEIMNNNESHKIAKFNR